MSVPLTSDHDNKSVTLNESFADDIDREANEFELGGGLTYLG